MLVDAGVLGTQRQPHAAQLLAALQATVPAEEKLAAILGGRLFVCRALAGAVSSATCRRQPLDCAAAFAPPAPAVSHHHPDHTGALPLLLEAFPDTPVAFYEDERPFLLGNKTFAQPGSLQARLFRWIGLLGERPFKARSSRLRAIAGRTGIQKACLRRLAVPSAHLSSTAFTVGISPWTTRHPAPLPQVRLAWPGLVPSCRCPPAGRTCWRSLWPTCLCLVWTISSISPAPATPPATSACCTTPPARCWRWMASASSGPRCAAAAPATQTTLGWVGTPRAGLVHHLLLPASARCGHALSEAPQLAVRQQVRCRLAGGLPCRWSGASSPCPSCQG